MEKDYVITSCTILGKVIDRIIPDKAGQAKAQAELNKALVTPPDIEKAAASVVVAEAKGEGWLQRNWRPLTMVSFYYFCLCIGLEYILRIYQMQLL